MYQRDYILRMIEMLGELIAGILGFIKKKEFQKASVSLENAYYDFLRQDASLFKNIPKEQLTSQLLNEHNFTNGHLEILSELFYAEAELLYAQNKHKESLEFYEKSLLLLEFNIKELKLFSSEKQSKIILLQNRIVQLKKV